MGTILEIKDIFFLIVDGSEEIQNISINNFFYCSDYGDRQLYQDLDFYYYKRGGTFNHMNDVTFYNDVADIPHVGKAFVSLNDANSYLNGIKKPVFSDVETIIKNAKEQMTYIEYKEFKKMVINIL